MDIIDKDRIVDDAFGDTFTSVSLAELLLFVGDMTLSQTGFILGVVVGVVVALVVVAVIVVVVIVIIFIRRHRRRRLVKTRRIELSEGLNEHCRSLLLF